MTTVPAAGLRPGRRLIAVMLLAAAALDLSRCGIVMANVRHAGPAAGLVSAGLAAAALSLWTAHGCQGGRRWSGWAALLIGAASAPQAAAAGFAAAYEIPDIATAALGVLLSVAVLATAGQTGQPEQFTDNPGSMCRRAARLSAPRPAPKPPAVQAATSPRAARHWVARVGSRRARPDRRAGDPDSRP